MSPLRSSGTARRQKRLSVSLPRAQNLPLNIHKYLTKEDDDKYADSDYSSTRENETNTNLLSVESEIKIIQDKCN